MRDNSIGFDTIGNATVICYDKCPILTTDPWVEGSAYFGSWGLSHEIPLEQRGAIISSKYIWYSHGHPDHLNWDSIHLFKDNTILLPDHYGKRIYNVLINEGYKVEVLTDNKWCKLSDNIKIICFSDIYQDAVLLIDINGRLIINTNDANRLLLWNIPVKRIIKKYNKTFLLCLTGHGDAEMINFRDDNDQLINPPELTQKNPIIRSILNNLDYFGIKHFIPFSSFHRYQRSDSIWAHDISVKMEEYTEAHLLDSEQIFPTYVRYFCDNDTFESIEPKESEKIIYAPEDFGDNWTDPLTKSEFDRVSRYFLKVEGLRKYWGYIIFKVGGSEYSIKLGNKKEGICFTAPRNSLLFSVDNNIFEDMMIGNFMKTQWIGKMPTSRLYPDTIPLVKYSDNGLVHTEKEVEIYLKEYAQRYPFDRLLASFTAQCANYIRKTIPRDSVAFKIAKRIYNS